MVCAEKPIPGLQCVGNRGGRVVGRQSARGHAVHVVDDGSQVVRLVRLPAPSLPARIKWNKAGIHAVQVVAEEDRSPHRFRIVALAQQFDRVQTHVHAGRFQLGINHPSPILRR